MKMKLVSFGILCALLLVPTIAFAENKVGYVITTGRIWSTVDAFVGLMNAIFAGLSLSRSIRRIGNGGRNGAIISVVVALIVIVYALIHMTMFSGDFGTGDGRAAAVIAVVTGIISIVLAGITLIRSRRAG
ncbi:DUF6223 family protein [Paenibacillus allorhizosphaerae]|uniref:Uncharacterized protein n=1 Tax=Paenibacillus allorhizosphaerae TaxID=2849866 RepID=A0ABM8VUF6_9BACL|nr:DUF6223 family protein [Paenibacillus allorhizosphaerae]CAG7658688.1 hypothetical protein PAECIP111802_07128 [Paenibacillus allorhizosphaerae]